MIKNQLTIRRNNMGCDIHAHIEVMIDRQWRHWAAPNIKRDYNLFSKMANVRNEKPDSKYYIEPISKPKGLPIDITFETKFHSDKMGSDGHSHSFLEGIDFENLIEWYEERRSKIEGAFSWEMSCLGYFLGNGWLMFKYNEFPKRVTNHRIVFWFDN